MLTPIDVACLEEARAASMLAQASREALGWAGGTMGFSGPGSWQNQVMGAGLGVPTAASEVDAMVAFYESRGVEARIEACPFINQSLLHELSERLFTVRELQNVLYFDFTCALPELTHGWPQNLDIQVIERNDPTAVEALVEVSLSGFIPSGESIPEALREGFRSVLKMARVCGFMARVDSQIVGGGLLDLHEGAANLAGTSVLPSFRRRGIQQALMLERLKAAREHGCAIATIDSKPGIPTERNAMRLGFAMAYTKMILAKAGPGLEPSP